MGHIIVLGKDDTRAQIFAMEWERTFDVQLEVLGDEVSLIRHIGQHVKEAKGIIVLLDETPKDKLLIGLKDETITLPTLFELPDGKETFHDQTLLFLKKLGFKQLERETEADYLAIRFYEFMTFSVAPCDIYLRMGSSNHVKIINKDEIYTKEILEHYRHKKITQLYIKKSDSSFYLKDLFQNVKDQFESRGAKPDKIASSIAGLDYINSALKEIGVDPTSIEMAKDTIKSVLEIMNHEPEMYKRMKDYLSIGSYLTEHSIAIAAMSCAITRGLNLNNQFTTKKLIIAALFHDISLKDQELSLIVNMDSREYCDISEEKKKEYSSHIYKSIEFLKEIPNLPANIETIVLEHHERPNGKGFPRGLDSLTITPLGCIFILAEEFIHNLFRLGINPKNRDIILEKMSQDYSRGNFKGPMNSLLRIFL